MKKKIIIILVLLIVLICGIVLFIKINNKTDKIISKKDFSNSWAEKYFDVLDSFKDLKEQKGNDTVYDVHFYDIGKKSPIMVLNSEDNSIKLSTIYYIDSKNKVKQLNAVASSVELLYHIESDKYDYYYDNNITGSEFDVYRKISDAIIIDGIDSFDEDGIATSEDGSGSFTVNGKEQTVKKFSDVFIKVEKDNKGFSYVVGEDAKKLKEKIKKNVKEYKTFKEVVNKDVENEIKDKLNEKNNKKEEMTNITSNATNNSIENNQQTNNEVNFTGTYYLALTDGSLAKDGSGTVTINSNGSCSYISGWSDFRCKSYYTNDHVICLKTEESSGDICFTLAVDNKMLIAPNNEKYIKE